MQFALKTALSVAAVLCVSLTAHADLGGFEYNDGYLTFLNEVTAYNAGQFGTNNSGPGGGPVSIVPGTGLWYGISGTRYPAFSSGGQTSYATGHQYFDRVNYGNAAFNALVLTTNSDGWSGPTLKYGYRLDSRDLDGLNPALTAGKMINVKFWWCPQILGTGDGGGLGPGTIGDTIEFVDSSGNVGLTLGAIQPGTTTDFVGYDNGAGFTQTAVPAYNYGYSQWDITLDLALQKVTFSYLDGLTNTSTTFITNGNLAATMNDFTELRFASTPGVYNSKNFSLDDFDFTVKRTDVVPEPGLGMTLCAFGITGVGLFLRRKIKR